MYDRPYYHKSWLGAGDSPFALRLKLCWSAKTTMRQVHTGRHYGTGEIQIRMGSSKVVSNGVLAGNKLAELGTSVLSGRGRWIPWEHIGELG